jgi:hypothetical protein
VPVEGHIHNPAGDVWRRRQERDGHPAGTNDPMFTNEAGQPVNPESIYQLVQRQVRRLDLPRICSVPNAAGMSDARLVITAVIIEGRSVTEAPEAYSVSRSWAYELVARCQIEGDRALEPALRTPVPDFADRKRQQERRP